jgi:glycosyltransferase involved in cell wall biosynthesis
MRRLFFACLVAILPLSLQAEGGLCLTVVVKNDEAVIKRCLKSAQDVVDCICICDAGSSDRTMEIVKKFMKKTGIPGQIHLHDWKDFAHNRTQSIQAAQKTVKALGFSLDQTYLLTLDADMVVNSTSAFQKNALEADSYLLSEHSTALGYYTYNAHLLRASLAWTHQGALCGSWVYKGPHQAAKLNSMSIESLDDGNFTAEQRNIKLITQALKDEPHNTCNILKLAHLQRCQKNCEKAIEGYKSYIELGNDKEEVWFSKYLIGKCYEEMGKWDEANKWYMEAYQYNSHRRDPLLKMATHYRKSNQNDMAYIFAKRGSAIEPAPDQLYFDECPLYNYRFDEELSIVGYYANSKEEGFTAASNLLIKKGVPWGTKYQAYHNIIFYTPAIKMSHFFPITLDFPLIRNGYEERYHPMNPSILKTDDGYKVICRTVNYTQKGAISANFKTIDAEGIFRTRNFLLHYDRDFKMLSQHEIFENLPRMRIFNWVEGMEDCRLVEIDNATWFTCTTSDTNPTGQRQISLCQLEDQKGNVKKLIPLLGPDPNRCEKNWLPFVKDGSFHVIYSCHPFMILQPDLETGSYETSLYYEPEHDFSGFRGSAAPIEYKNGYLMLIHETVQFADQSRNYLHRFLYLNKDFMVQQVSRPFIFFHLGIEFCCSMTLDHSGKELVMAIGIEDRQAYLGFVKLDTIEALLKPLPPTN